MTKQVRIENADPGTSFRVVVEVWDKYGDAEPVLVTRHELNSPTDLYVGHLTSSRYMVVREFVPPPVQATAG